MCILVIDPKPLPPEAEQELARAGEVDKRDFSDPASRPARF